MAGFLTPSVGISPLGSFAEGAAKQFNSNIAAADAQAAKEDMLWLARSSKLDQGVNDYNKYYDQTTQDANAYQAARSVTGSDQLTDPVYSAWVAGNRKENILDLANRAKLGPGVSANPDYQSSVMSGLQSGLQNRYDTINQRIGALPQKFQDVPGTPLPPSNFMNGQQQQPGQSPITISPAASSHTTTGLLPPTAFPNTPQGQADYGTHRRSLGLPDVPGVVTGHPEKQSPSEKADEDVNKQSQIRTQHDYIDALTKSRGQNENQGELAHDSDDFLNMIVNGDYKVGATQPLVDGVNRILSSIGTDVLQKYGLANQVHNTNEAAKVVARLQFGQIPNYHLGRWTEREVGMLRSMLPGQEGDNNTNAKIALLIRDGAMRQRNNNIAEWSAATANGGTADDIRNAMALSRQHDTALKDDYLPWTRINFDNKPDIEKMKGLPEGSWVEDTGQGPTHGFMYHNTPNGWITMPGVK